MKSLFIFLVMFSLGNFAQGQNTRVSLEASGLTCSMCSKAVLNALEAVDDVEKVRVDIKNQMYHISFTDDSKADFDALVKAVEDAGFSVAKFTVTTLVDKTTLEKDQHIQIGNQFFHFLNASGQQINGSTSFTIVDKNYTTPKTFKQYSGLSKMACVQTGKAESCCTSDALKKDTRIFHAII